MLGSVEAAELGSLLLRLPPKNMIFVRMYTRLSNIILHYKKGWCLARLSLVAPLTPVVVYDYSVVLSSSHDMEGWARRARRDQVWGNNNHLSSCSALLNVASAIHHDDDDDGSLGDVCAVLVPANHSTTQPISIHLTMNIHKYNFLLHHEAMEE